VSCRSLSNSLILSYIPRFEWFSAIVYFDALAGNPVDHAIPAAVFFGVTRYDRKGHVGLEEGQKTSL